LGDNHYDLADLDQEQYEDMTRGQARSVEAALAERDVKEGKRRLNLADELSKKYAFLKDNDENDTVVGQRRLRPQKAEADVDEADIMDMEDDLGEGDDAEVHRLLYSCHEIA